MKIRETINAVLNRGEKLQTLNSIYDSAMIIVIIISIMPLMYYGDSPLLSHAGKTCVIIFIVDYILRWITADLASPNKKYAILKYPITTFALIDLMSILPGLNLTHQAFQTMRVIRFLKIFRVLKLIKYSRKIQMLLNVLRKEKQILSSVFILAVFYIFFTALLVFNVEPHYNSVTGKTTFDSFFEALYWATITLTTVGYGDIVPTTGLGRLVSMFSALFGLAIIALPSGIITASYLDELRNHKQDENKRHILRHTIGRIHRKNKPITSSLEKSLEKSLDESLDKPTEKPIDKPIDKLPEKSTDTLT